jgi:hypothetical protein
MSMIIDGTNGLTFNNATTQNSGGKVLQVVNGSTTTYTSTSTSTYVTTTLNASITPLFSTSKILIFCSINGIYINASSNSSVATRLVRGSTAITGIDDVAAFSSTTNGRSGSVSISYLDSPATTSATTYTVQFAADPTGNTVVVQTYNSLSGQTVSTITLMEIAA